VGLTQYKTTTQSDRRVFRLLTPDGTIHETSNLRAWAREHSLSIVGLTGIFHGSALSHKGWRNADTPIDPPRLFGSRGKFDRSQQEEIVGMIKAGRSNKDISDEVGCHANTVGVYRERVGVARQISEEFCFQSPSGEVFKIPRSRLGIFAKEHGLNYACLGHLWNGRQNSHRGWTSARNHS